MELSDRWLAVTNLIISSCTPKNYWLARIVNKQYYIVVNNYQRLRRPYVVQLLLTKPKQARTIQMYATPDNVQQQCTNTKLYIILVRPFRRYPLQTKPSHSKVLSVTSASNIQTRSLRGRELFTLNSDIEFSVFPISCFMSVCLFVALSKATYAENSHILFLSSRY